MQRKKISGPDRILSYFKRQWPILLAVTVSGLIYNIGLLAGPWYEGQMTGCLVNILGGNAGYSDMLVLVISYVTVSLWCRFPVISSVFMSDVLPTTSTAA